MSESLHNGQVSVIVTNRNDPHIVRTVEGVLRTCAGADVVVVNDGWQRLKELPGEVRQVTPTHCPLGVGPARHAGIMAAPNKYAVLLDAHMQFPQRDWLARVLEPLEDDPTAISYSASIVIESRKEGLVQNGMVNKGAHLLYHGRGGFPLEVGWLKDSTGNVNPGTKTQIALGACYAFRQDRYHAIGQPWANAFGWGTSEQMLCVINEFLGGCSILSSAETAHVYWVDAVPWQHQEQTVAGKFYNRARLIDLLPIPKPEKDDMFRRVWRCAP